MSCIIGGIAALYNECSRSLYSYLKPLFHRVLDPLELDCVRFWRPQRYRSGVENKIILLVLTSLKIIIIVLYFSIARFVEH